MKIEVSNALANERVDRVVALVTGISRSKVSELISAGAVELDGKKVKSSEKTVEGQWLEFEIPEFKVEHLSGDSNVDFKVVFSDEHVIVVDKPAGLVVHAGTGNETGTLVHGLIDKFPDLISTFSEEKIRPGIVHRLDLGTSGLLVVARSRIAYEVLVERLKTHSEIQREYLALVWGHFDSEEGKVEAPIGRSEKAPTKMAVMQNGKEAITHYKVISSFDVPKVTFLKAILETGRTHQIRVHFAAIGHPVVCDVKYRGSCIELDDLVPMARPFLHAQILKLRHPVTNEELSFESTLPQDLSQLLDRLQNGLLADDTSDI